MNRKTTGQSIRDLIVKLRKEIPEVILRTTLILGFPSETEENFEELYEFVKEAKFDRLGAFPYSAEDGTPAALFKNQIEQEIKEERHAKIMELQQEISTENLQSKIGNVYRCMIEQVTEDGEFLIGRTYMDVPFEDGVIYIPNDGTAIINEFTNVRIIDSYEYDLIGELVH